MRKREKADHDLDDEIRAHLAIETQQRIEAGEPSDVARASALKDFGSVALVKEVTREMWGWTSIERLGQDLPYALRMLRKNPGFTLIAVLSLGLGIGGTTAVFGVLDAVVFRPLPVTDPDRLVILSPELRGRIWVLFNPIFEGLRQKQQALEGMFAVSNEPYLKVQFDGSIPVYARGSLVSGSYFQVLGLAPAAGRLFNDDDDRIPGTPGSSGCAAVISHDFWTSRFQKDSAVLGRPVRVKNSECRIVGVAPAGFRSQQPDYITDLWIPIRQVTDPKLLANQRMAFFGGVMGRLKKGMSIPQAQAELTGFYQQLHAAVPLSQRPSRGESKVSPRDVSMRLLPGGGGLRGLERQFGDPLRLILALVTTVLLIAAANVAGLLLARGASRSAEFATQAALGAGRARLIRQLITEGSLLAILGGVLGVALACWGTPILASLISISLALDTRPDFRLLAVAFAGTSFAALIAGVFPALHLSSDSLQASIGSAGRSTGTRSRQRFARSLVVVQLALSLLLTTGAGLLLRTMLRISAIDPGFRPDHVVAMEIRYEELGPIPSRVDKAEEKSRRAALYKNFEERLNELPGVRSASVSWLGLFGGNDLGLALVDPDAPEDKREAHVDYVSPRYFDTIGMRIDLGRGFTDHDHEGSLRVAVVNQALVKERFGGANAIGRRLALDYQGEEKRPFTIVGVVQDSKYNDLREKGTRPMMWVPLAQAPYPITSVMLRAEAGMENAVAREAREALSSVDPQLMVRKVTTLPAIVEKKTARERLMLGLASAFGGLALLLAAVGLYGTLAFAVTRRTREIGLRLALGADQANVLRSIVGEALAFVSWALVLGLPLALAGGYALRAFLFGVEAYDLPTLASACLVLTVTAIAAAYIPARRAASVDPMTALRHD